ncbi:MAG: TolC family protein, partial [Planctomycetales bacterium]|nr:TolC family protein [Planctomycetales bacterium]
ATAEFADWELGALFSVPIGRRGAKASVRAAEQELIRDIRLLQQRRLSVMYDLSNHLRQLEYLYLRFETVEKQLAAANKWVNGARLRYQNPNPDTVDSDGLVNILNDYLAAIRFRTDAAADRAAIIARYNTELVRLEETKGTLLSFLGIEYLADPCNQLSCFQMPSAPLGSPPVARNSEEPIAPDAYLGWQEFRESNARY